MSRNTWLERLRLYPKHERELILEYLKGMDEAGPVPDIRWLKERIKESELRAARKAKDGTATATL